MATDSAAISLCHEVILKALKTTPRWSAPGTSGMRFEHLKPCLDSRDLRDLLCEVVQSVVSGNPTIEVGQIGLAKENGDVRPIAVGECLRRLCARCISLQEKASMAAILAPVQYGVSTSEWLEQVVHQI